MSHTIPARMPFVALVGKAGPLFADRASFITMDWVISDLEVCTSRVTNWPRDERGDAMRALFDQAAMTLDHEHEPWSAPNVGQPVVAR
jgi:hypothetical protein